MKVGSPISATLIVKLSLLRSDGCFKIRLADNTCWLFSHSRVSLISSYCSTTARALISPLAVIIAKDLMASTVRPFDCKNRGDSGMNGRMAILRIAKRPCIRLGIRQAQVDCICAVPYVTTAAISPPK